MAKLTTRSLRATFSGCAAYRYQAHGLAFDSTCSPVAVRLIMLRSHVGNSSLLSPWCFSRCILALSLGLIKVAMILDGLSLN